ncbi:MAG: hypothetical protein H0W07_09030 [Chloroflexi bacterium]|nr:hypothetical protein [Chloroflexota bacterium]
MPSGPNFAHGSEAELARIFDFYQVRWVYEPRTFPILWNLDGVVVESFSPDFYLPDFELYLELTTLKQTLVRKKNRKLRRLRELYPDLRIKLFYAKDFKALLLKYGRIDVAASLTGLEGQARPGEPLPARPGEPLPARPSAQALALRAERLAATARAAAVPVPTGEIPATTIPAPTATSRVARGRGSRRRRNRRLAASLPARPA